MLKEKCIMYALLLHYVFRLFLAYISYVCIMYALLLHCLLFVSRIHMSILRETVDPS